MSEARSILGMPAPRSLGEALADVVCFGEDDEFNRALDLLAPATTGPERTMSYIESPDLIFSTDDRSYADVDVPEWGGTLRVRAPTSMEKDMWEAAMDGGEKDKAAQKRRNNARAELVVKCTVRDDGSRFFKPEHAEQLGRKNVAAVNRLFEKIIELGKISKDDVDQIEGNSDAGPSASSASD